MYKVLSVYQDGEIAGRCIKTFEELKTTVIKRINILKSGIVHEVVVLKDTKVLADQLKDYLVGFNYISFERKQNGDVKAISFWKSKQAIDKVLQTFEAKQSSPSNNTIFFYSLDDDTCAYKVVEVANI